MLDLFVVPTTAFCFIFTSLNRRLARIHYFSTDVDSPTWITTAPILTVTNATIADDYIASFYFISFTYFTCGYGDIHPTSSSEYVYATVFILLGTVRNGS